MKSFPAPSFFSAVYRKFQQDNALFLARGLAFDVLVCLIPATFVVFLLFGFLFDSPKETVQYMMTYMKSIIPFSSQQVLRTLLSIVKAKKVLGLIGFLGLIWTLTRVFGSMRTVLDSVFQVKKRRGTVEGKLFDLKMMLLSTVFFLSTVLVTSLFSILKRLSTGTLGRKFHYLGTRWELVSILLAFSFTVALFFCLYRFVPNRRIKNETALCAAIGAGVLWELAKHGFRFYLLKFADLGQLFGSFGLLLAIFLWVYYSCIAFVLGAEIGWALEKNRPE